MGRTRLQKYTVTFAIAHVRDRCQAFLLTQRPTLQIRLINLRNRPLSNFAIKSMSKTIPCLFHSLITETRQFPMLECSGVLVACLETSPFRITDQNEKENIKPSSSLRAPAGMMAPARGFVSSPSDLTTPVLPEKMLLGDLMADHRNCVRLIEFDGITFTRVISPVYSSDRSELPNLWKVTDYTKNGNTTMSVICHFTERCLENTQVLTRGTKRERSDGSSSGSLQPPPKKPIRV